MQKKITAQVIGGFGAAALIGLGMALSVPHMWAQSAGQAPPANERTVRSPRRSLALQRQDRESRCRAQD